MYIVFNKKYIITYNYITPCNETSYILWYKVYTTQIVSYIIPSHDPYIINTYPIRCTKQVLNFSATLVIDLIRP